MRQIKLNLCILSLLIFSVLQLNSCGRTEDTVSCFPSAPINVSISLNSFLNYANNLNNNGWTYVDIQGAGTRGLILVKTNSGYRAYDRNAPHICPDNETTLMVEYPYVICKKDNAKWILLTGEPNAVASLPLKSYPCYFDANTNTIVVSY
ncbi:MAG: hypothetical protein Q4C75_03765 [Bergeyella zoohelcum]|nr:hypothetical protein [Bergeyella zoohelcum]